MPSFELCKKILFSFFILNSIHITEYFRLGVKIANSNKIITSEQFLSFSILTNIIIFQILFALFIF